MKRPSWDEHWMNAADLAAEMSSCVSGRRVGAIAVADNRLLATGFNGVPSGYPHPTVCARRGLMMPSGVHPHLCGCQHAESNLVANAARHGVSIRGSTLYCTAHPCAICMGMIANAGIRRIIYRDPYPDIDSPLIAKYAGIEVLKYA